MITQLFRSVRQSKAQCRCALLKTHYTMNKQEDVISVRAILHRTRVAYLGQFVRVEFLFLWSLQLRILTFRLALLLLLLLLPLLLLLFLLLLQLRRLNFLLPLLALQFLLLGRSQVLYKQTQRLLLSLVTRATRPHSRTEEHSFTIA